MSRLIGETALKNVQKIYPNVRFVKDANKRLNITVTSKINKLATVKNHTKCAMAVAAEQQCKADAVIIGRRSAYVIKKNHAVRYEVPARVNREIVSFDRGAGFFPGEYELHPPAVQRRLGAPYSGKTHNKSNRNRPSFRKLVKVPGVRTDLREKNVV